MKRAVLVFLFLIGIFIPTSFNYQINGGLSVAGLLLMSVLLVIWLMFEGRIPRKSFFLVLTINAILLFSTLISPFNEYSYGALVPIITFSILFCLNLKNLSIGKKSLLVFNLINVVNIVLGLLIIADVAVVKDIFLKYYAAYYPELLPNMLSENKPVLFFSSHSRAAFHLFLFFAVTLFAYRHTNKTYYLLFTLGYMFLIFNLKSNTSYAFSVLALSILLIFLFRYKFRMLLSATIIVSIVSIFNLSKVLSFVEGLYFQISYTFLSQSNGLIGRYSSDGILADNIRYMADNLFRPVGLGYSDELFFSDSGIVLFTLRGTIVMTLLIYACLFVFLRRNLNYKYQAYLLFVTFLLMDFGTPTLTYFRTLLILPFLIVIINKLSENIQEEVKPNLETSVAKAS